MISGVYHPHTFVKKEQKSFVNENLSTDSDQRVFTVLDHLMGSRRTWSGINNRLNLNDQAGKLPGYGTGRMSFDEVRVKKFMESCAFKAMFSCVGGFVIGIGFGVFTASIDPMSTYQTMKPGVTPSLKDVWHEMKARSMSYAKSFALVGLVFSTVECNIESYRAKSDIRNGTYAGFVTGSLLGFRGGLQAALFGGLAFGAFSTVIEYYLMQRH